MLSTSRLQRLDRWCSSRYSPRRRTGRLRVEPRGLLDREGLGGDVALLRRLRIGDERRRVEIIGLELRVVEAGEVAFIQENCVVIDVLAHEDGVGLGEVGEAVIGRVRMRHEHLRILLEDRRDVDHRHALLDVVEAPSVPPM